MSGAALAASQLHEYNFFIHNQPGYEPGRATAFFVLMGLLMLAEGAITRRLSPLAPSSLRLLPSAAIAIGLQLIVLPAFAPLFMQSWLDSGMLEALGELMPHVRCAAKP